MKQFRNAPACAVPGAAGRECGMLNGPTLTLILALALSVIATPLAAEAQLCGRGDFSYGVPGTPRERGVTLAV